VLFAIAIAYAPIPRKSPSKAPHPHPNTAQKSNKILDNLTRGITKKIPSPRKTRSVSPGSYSVFSKIPDTRHLTGDGFREDGRVVTNISTIPDTYHLSDRLLRDTLGTYVLAEKKIPDKHYVFSGKTSLRTTPLKPNLLYLSLALFGYHFDNPGYTLAATASQINADKRWTLKPQLELGYIHYHNKFLTILFGNQLTLGARYALLFGDTDKQRTLSGMGDIYSIAGGDILNTNGIVEFKQEDAKINLYLHDVLLFASGKKILNNTWYVTPTVGLAYVLYKQNIHSTVLAQQTSPATDQCLDVLSEDISAQYIGADLGTALHAVFAKYFSAFIQANVQLLTNFTHLDAEQTVFPNINNPMNISIHRAQDANNNKTFTFRLTGTTGLTYYFEKNHPDVSMRLTLAAGLDYWENLPAIVNPNTAGKTVRINFKSAFNPFIGLGLYIPLT